MSLSAAEVWDRLLSRARQELPETTFRTWLEPTEALALGQWLGYIAAHERRHLYQIENIQFHPDYPDESPAGLYMRMAA